MIKDLLHFIQNRLIYCLVHAVILIQLKKNEQNIIKIVT